MSLNRVLNEYLKIPYKHEIVPDVSEGGYVAYYPDLPGCITCADNIDDAARMAEDAKIEWLTAAIESGIKIGLPDTSKTASYTTVRKVRQYNRLVRDPSVVHRSAKSYAGAGCCRTKSIKRSASRRVKSH